MIEQDGPTSAGDNKVREVYGRTHHGFPMHEATAFDAKYTVDPIPQIDHAAAALHKAQDAYLEQWPEARLSDLIWTIRAE